MGFNSKNCWRVRAVAAAEGAEGVARLDGLVPKSKLPEGTEFRGASVRQEGTHRATCGTRRRSPRRNGEEGEGAGLQLRFGAEPREVAGVGEDEAPRGVFVAEALEDEAVLADDLVGLLAWLQVGVVHRRPRVGDAATAVVLAHDHAVGLGRGGRRLGSLGGRNHLQVRKPEVLGSKKGRFEQNRCLFLNEILQEDIGLGRFEHEVPGGCLCDGKSIRAVHAIILALEKIPRPKNLSKSVILSERKGRWVHPKRFVED